MNIVLLSGGKGTRLWPVSTENCPKQFLSFFGDNKSMLEKTYYDVKKTFYDVYIATQEEHKEIIDSQIDDKINYIIEPQKRGTFGAILNAAVYLKYEKCILEDDFVSIIPTDHDVDYKFYEILLEAKKLLIEKNLNICLIGIQPTFPSSQFGYILSKNSLVEKFCEKPNENDAKKLINKKALWNSGIVVFRLKYIIDISKRYLEYQSYNEFLINYWRLPNNSFDKEVLEKEKCVCLVESSNAWNDLGTWEVMSQKISKPDKFNTNVINFEQKEIRNRGIKNSIIVNSMNGLLLLNKNPDKLYWKDWGYYKIICNFEEENKIKLKLLNIFKGKNIGYQYHNYRNETWFILSGEGEVIINNKLIKVRPGDVLNILIGQLHCIKAKEDIKIIEIQYGSKNVESDIVRIERDWNKVLNLIGDKNNE